MCLVMLQEPIFAHVVVVYRIMKARVALCIDRLRIAQDQRPVIVGTYQRTPDTARINVRAGQLLADRLTYLS